MQLVTYIACHKIHSRLKLWHHCRRHKIKCIFMVTLYQSVQCRKHLSAIAILRGYSHPTSIQIKTKEMDCNEKSGYLSYNSNFKAFAYVF